ncbi:MAG: peptidoglycan DD-metalloendopeptidase family protein [Rikenellaceae bacterium]|nr:peptidoglycan DD-metalloendopeptidase family protein [Rikenellaceae bacterium]
MTRTRLLLTLLFALATLSVPAQQLESLREEIRQAEEEIKMTNQLLSKTQKNQQTTDRQLNLIRNKIRNRKNIISNLEKQSGLIENNIGAKNTTIRSLEQDLNRLRQEYAAMVYDSYKNYKLNNFMLFLFASRDFNDATLRIAYMHRYNRMREQKAAEIDSVSASVGREISSLQSQKEELDKVSRSRNEELTSLDKDETQYRTSSQKLQQEAGKLNSIIKANRKRIEQMQKQIRQIIAEESRKNKAKPQTSEQREFDVKLSGQFEQNTGKLPYPVRGVIVNNYGLHSHTAIKGVVEKNQGVDIAAEPGAEVRAVFEGEVSQVLLNQWTNKVVLLRHGNYLTLYSNLASVNVKVGDRVTLNQPIGRIASSEDSNDCTLHFEVWKLDAQNNPVNLNPEKWLRR